jgi:mRNA interferase RelE/StbE
MYQVELLPAAARDLKRIEKKMQVRIVAALQDLADNPRPAGVVKLAGEENVWRIREGDYRILYEIHDRRLLVLVVRIGHRRDVYRP